jgi:transposase
MKDTTLYDELLGLKQPWYVAGVRLDVVKQEVEVEVRSKDTTWACPECQGRMHIHEYAERRWRHLDSCQFKTIIVCQVPRVQCSEHGTQMVQVPWAEKQGRFTKLFERFAIAVLQECSTSAGSGLLKISWDEADGIKQRAVKRGLERKEEKVCPQIGIDEKSYGKGNKFVTIVASIQEEATIGEHVGDGKGKDGLKDYWSKFDKIELQAIEAISMDMSAAYRQSVIDNVPDAPEKVVFDRFHIMQHVNESLNEVRREEQKELSSMGNTILAGTRIIWLYGEENVPERYNTILGELKGKKLKTARGWALKEAIRGLWKCSTEKEGQVFFEEWYSWAIRSRLEPVKKVARMMKRHLPNIVSYFRHRITNAALEGINNKIQSLIKKAYGYRNTDRFKNDILFHCGGLNLYPEICQ